MYLETSDMIDNFKGDRKMSSDAFVLASHLFGLFEWSTCTKFFQVPENENYDAKVSALRTNWGDISIHIKNRFVKAGKFAGYA